MKTLSKGSKEKGTTAHQKKRTKNPKALAKGSSGSRSKPTKRKLDNMGEISIKERVEMATKGSETAEEACQKLRDSMTEKRKTIQLGETPNLFESKPRRKRKSWPAVQEGQRFGSHNVAVEERASFLYLCCVQSEYQPNLDKRGGVGVRKNNVGQIWQRWISDSSEQWPHQVYTRPRVPGWRGRPRTICQIEGQRPSQTLAWHGYLAKR